MKKLGKKNNKNLETIQAFGCDNIKVCDCSSNSAGYQSKNNNLYWRVFFGFES